MIEIEGETFMPGRVPCLTVSFSYTDYNLTHSTCTGEIHLIHLILFPFANLFDFCNCLVSANNTADAWC